MARRAPDESDESLDECGLTYLDVAVTAGRAFALALGHDPDLADGEDLGWAAVARRAGAMFKDADEQEISLSFTDFGKMLRRAFARGADPDAEVSEWEALDRPVQVAWITVARHMSNVFNLEPREARRLDHHERQIAAWAAKQLTPTSLTPTSLTP